VSDLAARATRWYRVSARDLPWRRPGTSPWAVLVSEVMLQQTPVARVLPAWREWVERWPVPRALGEEPPAAAIRAWGRLGYPRRALRLHACAVELVTRHGGAVPSELGQLLALPGIGAYTARAVAAFAYGQRQPVVDTNVRRVVARAVRGVPDAGPATTVRDLSEVERLLPESAAAAAVASVAFMELGALICTARGPRCADCPLAPVCAWRLTTADRGAEGGADTGGQAAPGRRSQRYAGTDRQARGRILAVLREAPGPVPRTRIDAVWPDAAQRRRALAGLVADGLACEVGHGRYALPGLDGFLSQGLPAR
jgi:A/G-specific adenine glycosylase